MRDQRTIQTVFTLHQTQYFYEVNVERLQFGLVSSSWVWAAINAEADRSEIRRSQNAEISACLKVLESLKSHVRWRRLSSKTVEQLEMEDLILMFSDIEDKISESAYSPNVKHSYSIRTRALLKRYLKKMGFAKIERVSVYFKSKLQLDRSQHRKLISDMPVKSGSDVVPPLGALRHENIANLRRKTEEALLETLDKITNACVCVLDAADKQYAGVQTLLREPVDEVMLARLLAHALTGRFDVKTRAWVGMLDIREVAHAYLHIVLRCLPLNERATNLQILRQKEIDKYLCRRLDLARSSFVLFFQVGTLRTLVACLLLIQRHTKWNVNSVLELNETFISAVEPPFEMHSLKKRTNTLTPVVLVEKGDSNVLRAIEYLRDRLRFMKQMKWLSEEENRFWLSAKSARAGKKIEPLIGWGSELINFCADFGLPKFSFEQMRVQTLALEAVQRGASSAQGSAGHQSISTTGIYIDQLLLNRLNSAVNYEFQLRIESEVVYVNDETQRGPILMFPVGDGSSCSNPSSPPFDEYLKQGACDGNRCHSDGGCENNTIRIDDLRVEEAVRTSLYYGANWKRLHENNVDAFVDRHLPNMIFNIALIEVLKRGPYGHLVKSVMGRIGESGVVDER